MKAKAPSNESQRLTKLNAYKVLDTQAEQSYDDLTLLASHICQTPVALVSFVDENRQWFKSKTGIDATETPRDYAFCAHAILDPSNLLEVEDAQHDPRFSDNPLVTSDPHIRFYAGAPLVSPDGSALGTLCVIDYKKRKLTKEQKLALQALSRSVVSLLELRHHIDEVKRVEETLRENEAKFHDLIDNANDLVQICDIDGSILYANRAWLETLGYTEAEGAKLKLKDIIHPNSLDSYMEQLQQTVEEKKLLNVNAVFQTKGGKDIIVEGDSTCRQKDGKPISIRSIFRNITELKLGEDRFRKLVALSPYGIVMTDESGLIILVNSMTEKLFGYTQAELIGHPIEILIPERFRADHPEKRHHYTAKPEVRAMGVGRDLFGRRKNGSEFPLEIGLSPFTTSEGVSIMAAVADITERKRAEQLLYEKNDELKTFAYTVSHDLKAPLRGISGYAQELERRHRDGLSDRAQFCINQIITASHNLDSLIEDLLKYSRLDTEPPKVTEVTLSSVMANILDDYSHIVAEKNITVDVNIPRITLHIWERGLHQIMSNLIDNAIKYSRNANPPKITIRAKSTKTGCQITITDNGIGFDMKYHDRIFGLFNRLVRGDDFVGTGAGLAIVKKLVEKLDGSIHAESAPGSGATFVVALPNSPPADRGA